MPVTEEGRKILAGETRQYRPVFQLVDVATGETVIRSETQVLTARSPFDVDWHCNVTEKPLPGERVPAPPEPVQLWRRRPWRGRLAWLR